MWPFKIKQSVPKDSDIVKEYLDTYDRKIADKLRIHEEALTKEFCDQCHCTTNAFKTLHDNIQHEITKLEGAWKQFLGVKNYEKTQNNREVLVPGGLLDHILTTTKAMSLQLKKLTKE